MPKDADFNCGVNDGRTPVEQYADVTRGAHGAIDFWVMSGNGLLPCVPIPMTL